MTNLLTVKLKELKILTAVDLIKTATSRHPHCCMPETKVVEKFKPKIKTFQYTEQLKYIDSFIKYRINKICDSLY